MQFLALKKYIVDGLLSAEKLAQCDRSHVRTLANLLKNPKIQPYLDQIVLESNQPVQILDTQTFVKRISKRENQHLLDSQMLSTTQLLRATEHGLQALHDKNQNIYKLYQQKLITIDQMLTLNQHSYRALHNPYICRRYIDPNKTVEQNKKTVEQILLSTTTRHFIEVLDDENIVKLYKKELITFDQMLTLNEQDYRALRKNLICRYIHENKITVKQIVALTEDGKEFLGDWIMTPFMEPNVYTTTIAYLEEAADNQAWLNKYKDQLSALMKDNQLQPAQFFELHAAGKQLLCTTTMGSLIQSKQIELDEFMGLGEAIQQRLYAHWDVLAPLLVCDPPQQRYTLEQLVAVIMHDENFKALSDPEVKQFVIKGKLPVETLFELSGTDKNRLCGSDLLKSFFEATDEVKIADFFKWHTLNQKFLERYWPLLLKSVNDQQLTWDQIKKSTPNDLDFFEKNGVGKYLEHINQEKANENCIIS